MPKTFGKLGTRVRASRRPHPEERACRRRSANLARACARLEGLILMSPHASRRRLRRLLSMRASVVGGILAKRSQWGACLLDPCETDLRLQETIAGSGPLFRACYLQ